MGRTASTRDYLADIAQSNVRNGGSSSITSFSSENITRVEASFLKNGEQQIVELEKEGENDLGRGARSTLHLYVYFDNICFTVETIIPIDIKYKDEDFITYNIGLFDSTNVAYLRENGTNTNWKVKLGEEE